MMSYTHFTLNERKYLQELLSEGYSFRKNAEFLGRNVSSVSREVKEIIVNIPRRKATNSATIRGEHKPFTLSEEGRTNSFV